MATCESDIILIIVSSEGLAIQFIVYSYSLALEKLQYILLTLRQVGAGS